MWRFFKVNADNGVDNSTWLWDSHVAVAGWLSFSAVQSCSSCLCCLSPSVWLMHAPSAHSYVKRSISAHVQRIVYVVTWRSSECSRDFAGKSKSIQDFPQPLVSAAVSWTDCQQSWFVRSKQNTWASRWVRELVSAMFRYAAELFCKVREGSLGTGSGTQSSNKYGDSRISVGSTNLSNWCWTWAVVPLLSTNKWA